MKAFINRGSVTQKGHQSWPSHPSQASGSRGTTPILTLTPNPGVDLTYMENKSFDSSPSRSLSHPSSSAACHNSTPTGSVQPLWRSRHTAVQTRRDSRRSTVHGVRGNRSRKADRFESGRQCYKWLRGLRAYGVSKGHRFSPIRDNSFQAVSSSLTFTPVPGRSRKHRVDTFFCLCPSRRRHLFGRHACTHFPQLVSPWSNKSRNRFFGHT